MCRASLLETVTPAGRNKEDRDFVFTRSAPWSRTRLDKNDSMTEQAKMQQRTSVASVPRKLEVLVIPVSDIERAKVFYQSLGFVSLPSFGQSVPASLQTSGTRDKQNATIAGSVVRLDTGEPLKKARPRIATSSPDTRSQRPIRTAGSPEDLVIAGRNAGHGWDSREEADEPYGEDWYDAEWLKPYESKGQLIHLDEADQKSVNLTLIETHADAAASNWRMKTSS